MGFNLGIAAYIVGNVTTLITQAGESTRLFRQTFKDLQTVRKSRGISVRLIEFGSSTIAVLGIVSVRRQLWGLLTRRLFAVSARLCSTPMSTDSPLILWMSSVRSCFSSSPLVRSTERWAGTRKIALLRAVVMISPAAPVAPFVD